MTRFIRVFLNNDNVPFWFTLFFQKKRFFFRCFSLLGVWPWPCSKSYPSDSVGGSQVSPAPAQGGLEVCSLTTRSRVLWQDLTLEWTLIPQKAFQCGPEMEFIWVAFLFYISLISLLWLACHYFFAGWLSGRLRQKQESNSEWLLNLPTYSALSTSLVGPEWSYWRRF